MRGSVAVGDEYVSDLGLSKVRPALWLELAEANEADRQRLALEVVRSATAAVLGRASADLVPADRTFEALGFDSLSAIELADRLAEATGLPLIGTLVFDYPSPAALAEHLLVELFGRHGRSSAVDVALVALDNFELALSNVTPDDPKTQQITDRVRSMLSRWHRTVSGAPPTRQSDDLERASADEIFDIIQSEFGKSGDGSREQAG